MKMLCAVAMMLALTGCRQAPRTVMAEPSAAPRATAAASPDAAHLSTYRDPETGVSFRYPDVWKPFQQGQDMAFPAFHDHAPNARASFAFSPKGNLYEKTNLVGLTFSYTMTPVQNAAACRQIASGSATGSPGATTVQHGGNAFFEAHGTDAGMCHTVDETVDTLYRDGRCFVFERDFQTMCPDVRPGERALTAGEEKALRRHLDAVMDSVTLPSMPPPGQN